MNKKYEFTGETLEVNGITLNQIKAIRSFGNVKKGDVGGYIEKESNLSHSGNCWVFGDGWVFGNAKVSGNAKISGDALIFGNAWISQGVITNNKEELIEKVNELEDE